MVQTLQLCGVIALVLTALTACASHREASFGGARDDHSESRPEEVRSTHLELDLEVDFAASQLSGFVLHHLAIAPDAKSAPFVLDSKALVIEGCETGPDKDALEPANWRVDRTGLETGDRLVVKRREGDRFCRIAYRTTDAGTGLQWLRPEQTAGKRRPFLFSQSQAIHARTWIPCQDSPGVRVTYEARIKTPDDLVAVMGAESLTPRDPAPIHRFRMPQPIPSYLIALAVGDLAFRDMSNRTGVWAEPSVVEAAAWEFADTEKMMETVEGLYGPYQWGRFDVLVLPPSFPFGGMENPRLTFATPTILAGDRSLVALIAHELAHSWSGNLVTNATHRDFWLNEGFTVFLEQRIMEAVYGPERYAMEVTLAIEGLKKEMAELDPRDQILHVDLEGRDPDDGFTSVPYDKGAAFLRRLEEVFGRERFDEFLRDYFDRFSFKSITTETFRRHLESELLSENPEAAAQVDIDQWIDGPGLPDDLPIEVSRAFEAIDDSFTQWQSGARKLREMGHEDWTTQEWLHFISKFGERSELGRLKAVDEAFALTQSKNTEITSAWLQLAVRSEYRAADAKVEAFLLGQGRRKFLTPLYRALKESSGGRPRALAIYRRARPTYHAISVSTLDELLSWSE